MAHENLSFPRSVGQVANLSSGVGQVANLPSDLGQVGNLSHKLIPLLAAVVFFSPGHVSICAAASPDDTASLASWKWIHELPKPPGSEDSSLLIDFVLPVAVFDESRTDLGDLRFFDGRDREVPFAVRVRRTQNEQQVLKAKQFNRQENSDRSIQVSLDLGENPSEHQQIDVVAKGDNFRRRVQLQGSNDEQKWGVLLDRGWLVRYESQGVNIDRLNYPSSRFRYLQVRVYPDLSQSDDKPEIKAMSVYHTVKVPGEYVTRSAQLSPREAVRYDYSPGSAWGIDLGGDHVPLEKLTFDVAGSDFSRPYVLERIEDDTTHVTITRGEWQRRSGESSKPLEIVFSNEIVAHRLRLVVIDHANSPLKVQSAQYTAPARQVVFARKDLAMPLRLYTGNSKAESPHYDFDKNLPLVLQPAPQRFELGPSAANPVYQPEPKPLTERWPWLVYVVLGTASLILLLILGVLARKAISRHDAHFQV